MRPETVYAKNTIESQLSFLLESVVPNWGYLLPWECETSFRGCKKRPF